MNDLIARLTSRKFLLAIFGVVTVFFSDTFNITPDQQDAIVTFIITFTAAEGVADAVTRYTNIPTVEESVTKKK
ncbi:MAG TPA: hypothetical protein VF571_09265 [Pyrinomonadaceae bacterium]|jgi:hypothetical protein